MKQEGSGLLRALRAIWKSRAKLTREEIEAHADQLEAQRRELPKRDSNDPKQTE